MFLFIRAAFFAACASFCAMKGTQPRYTNTHLVRLWSCSIISPVMAFRLYSIMPLCSLICCTLPVTILSGCVPSFCQSNFILLAIFSLFFFYHTFPLFGGYLV